MIGSAIQDVDATVVRGAIVVVGLCLVWIVGSLVVDVVRLIRGSVTTRTFMGAVARFLVAGATTVPFVFDGTGARASSCEATRQDGDDPVWLTPVVSGVTALGVVLGRERLRRSNEPADVALLSDGDLKKEEYPVIVRNVVPTCVPTYEFVVSVLGPVQVLGSDGTRVRFARARSEELVVWLALHPSRRFRSMARGDMWVDQVKDSTFANVTSDARRALNEAGGDGDWLSVTLTDEMPVKGIVTDLEILRRCHDHARRWPEDDGVEALRFGLSLVRGTPFSGTSYLWSDSTGLATDATMQVVRSAQLLADMCAELDDVEGVYWATAQGLLAAPGHEDLIGRRLRLHASRGDRAGLATEWSSYLRMLASDPWSDGSPSATMAELWRDVSRVG